ncbi:hypothetical protein GCM10009638_15900 [Luteococcus sanguinis]
MLVVLATIMFGPEKIPEFSRKAARVVFFLRNIANNAQNQLRAELGPEYADLDIRDLNPKTFVQKHIINAVQDDLDEIKADLEGVKSEMEGSAKDLKMLGEDVRHDVERQSSALAAEGAPVPVDLDAT